MPFGILKHVKTEPIRMDLITNIDDPSLHEIERVRQAAKDGINPEQAYRIGEALYEQHLTIGNLQDRVGRRDMTVQELRDDLSIAKSDLEETKAALDEARTELAAVEALLAARSETTVVDMVSDMASGGR